MAYEGLLGDMVRDIGAPGTDASPIGILGSLLAFCGALVPGAAYFHRHQTTSPYIALVGESTVARKGTAMNRARDAMTEAIDVMYVSRVIFDGINSGEGLVSALHYKRKEYKHEPTVVLVFEEEFASLLASRGREGSTLDPKMRQAFDGGVISNRRARDTVSVEPPYWLPALIGITPSELRERIGDGALQSGSANRWLYLPVRKLDLDPLNDQPMFTPTVREEIIAARRWAIDRPRVLAVDPVVTTTLTRYSDFLAEHSTGVARDLTRRLPVIAFRIALIHAMVERADEVTPGHLARAGALVEYARRGVPWVFGSTIGNKDARNLLRVLRLYQRLTKKQITQHVIRDQTRQQDAIDELIRLGLAEIATIETGGRPRTELALGPESGALVPFGAFGAGFASESPYAFSETPHLLHQSAQDAAPKVHQSSTEAAPISTEETPLETIACSDYRAHQTQHYRTAQGWICPVCTPPIH